MLITYTNSAIVNSNMTVDVLYIAGSVDKSDYCCEERMTVQQSTSLADLYNVLS